jgi:hypothetical protein
MSRAKIVLSTFLGAAALAGALAAATTAAAYVDRYPSYACQPEKPTAVGYYDLYGGGTAVFCPIPSTLDRPLNKVSRLIAKGHDGNTNGGVTAQACVKFKDELGGYCGHLRASFVDPVTWAGGATTGSFTLTLKDDQLAPFQWWPDAYGFLYMGLKSTVYNGADHFYGYTVADQIVLDGPIVLPGF